MTVPLVLLVLLTIKHLIFDFFCQSPYQYLNKGKYGHPGGLLHTGLHMVGSFVIMYGWGAYYQYKDDLFTLLVAIIIGEGLIHYHTDWSKVQINRKMGWHASNSEWFWYLLGIDQFIHSLTYIGMAYLYGC